MFHKEVYGLYKAMKRIFIFVGVIFCTVGVVGYMGNGNIGAEDSIIFLVFMTMGLIVLFTGLFVGMRYHRIKRKRQYLIQNGQKLYAKIIRIEYDHRYESGYSYAKRLICQYDTPEGGTHIFVSDPVWMDICENVMGDQVAVYVEHGNLDNYYVKFGPAKSGMAIHIH